MKVPESYAEFLAMPYAEREELVRTLSARSEPKASHGTQLEGRSLDPLVVAANDAMKMLRNMACGGIGETGPTLEELDDHAEKTGRSWDDESDYHTAQWAWRRLQQGLHSHNTTGQARPENGAK